MDINTLDGELSLYTQTGDQNAELHYHYFLQLFIEPCAWSSLKFKHSTLAPESESGSVLSALKEIDRPTRADATGEGGVADRKMM